MPVLCVVPTLVGSVDKDRETFPPYTVVTYTYIITI